MGRLKKLYRKVFFSKFDRFAKELGYSNWRTAADLTFNIYHLESNDEAWYYITRLPDAGCAVWKDDEGEPPYPLEEFSSWGEAIKHLRELFEESGLPENNWSHERWENDLKSVVDKETQIEILLYGNAYSFACEKLGVNDMRIREYSDVFTVSEEEVHEYMSDRELPQFDQKPIGERVEGFHYYKEEGRWHTFFLERGQIFDEKNFDDEELGKRYIISLLLKLNGTGLY